MQIATKSLISELTWCQKFIDKKTTIPILSMVLFEAGGSQLKLTATDLEVGANTGVAGVGADQWDVAAPVGKLIQYLGKVDEPEVTLTAADNHWLTVRHGTSTTRIAGMSKESYPELPAFPQSAVTLGRMALAVKRTEFAISAEESRFTLNGALLEIDEDEARLVSTDGHRLSLAPVQVKGKQDVKLNALIPRKALHHVGQFEEDCKFSLRPPQESDPGYVFFDFGQRKIVARALKGNFPDWRRVVGDDFPSHIMIPVKTTLKTIERVALYADERSHCIRFNINGKLTIFASSLETGEAEGIVAYQGGVVAAPLEYGLNADYVTDFLKVTDAQFVGFCWSDQKSCCQFVTTDEWRYAVMPMRI